jgi:hypothetical protein
MLRWIVGFDPASGRHGLHRDVYVHMLGTFIARGAGIGF